MQRLFRFRILLKQPIQPESYKGYTGYAGYKSYGCDKVIMVTEVIRLDIELDNY